MPKDVVNEGSASRSGAIEMAPESDAPHRFSITTFRSNHPRSHDEAGIDLGHARGSAGRSPLGQSAVGLLEPLVSVTLEIYRVGRIMEGFLQRYDLLLMSTLTFPPVPIGHFKPSGHEMRLLSLLEIFPIGKMLRKALLTLSEPVIAFIGNTLLFNMSGQPAASIPLFWNAAGIPIGIQLGARFGQDAMLFRIGGQLERVWPWFNRRPPVLSAT